MAREEKPSPLDSRPGILLVGSPNVGKRTILSRLLSVDFGNTFDLSIGVLCHGWNIDTKYYSADVTIWTAHLDDEFSLGALPMSDKLAALVMVFDLNNLESFSALKAWAMDVDMSRFDILLCIGNKVDLLPGHFAHVEYRRQLKKHGESSSHPHPEFEDYGILDTEGSSLLDQEEIPWEIRRSCWDWCLEHNIEYVEACASNADFDKCLSINGDIQGLERLFGALSAHMWPGMILKTGNRVAEVSLPENEDVSDEGSEYELEYEILSRGSAEPWNDSDDSWVAFTEAQPQVDNEDRSTGQEAYIFKVLGKDQETSYEGKETITTSQPTSSTGNLHASMLERLSEQCLEPTKVAEVSRSDSSNPALNYTVELHQDGEITDEKYLEYEDLEHLISEIGNMRNNLRIMPDFQRREMAAMLAMKMASMFGCGSDDEGLD